MADKEDIPSYDFSHKYRGNALIIVNENFYDHSKTPIQNLKRKGATKDLRKMKNMFKALDFNVKAYKDLSQADMNNKIQKASQNKEFNKNSDCFALVISSHGEEVEEKKARNVPDGAQVWRHCVIGSDQGKVYIDDVMSCFQDDKAKGLKGKPKLFFIQACRSRHGNKNKRYDYGTFIQVAVKRQFNVQSSDAMDCEDNRMFENLDGIEIEDLYEDLEDADVDEWNEDEESGDDDSIIDSDEESDARGGPDSGYMPPSPSPPPVQATEQLQQAQQPQEDQECPNLSTPNLPKRDDKPINPTSDRIENNENQRRGEGDIGRGNQADAGGSPDTGMNPRSPFDVVPIKCPKDCLIVYPAVSGALSFRREDLGSRLLHCMGKDENLHKLVKGCDLLHYLTDVSGDMASVEIYFDPYKSNYKNDYAKELVENMPFKVTAVTSHRLTKQVVFKAKKQKSLMAVLVKRFKELFY